MALKAFELRDGTNVMSAMAARLAVPITIGELRMEMNGWRSQALLHTADPLLFTENDLLPYAADRGYSKDALQVQAMVRTIRASIGVSAVYSFPGQSWALRLARSTPEYYALPDLSGLGSTLAGLRSVGTPLNVVAFNSWSGGSWETRGIGCYQATLTESELRSYLIGIGYPTLKGDAIERVVNLRGYVERQLANAGVPMVLFEYQGLVNGYVASTSAPNVTTFYDTHARLGATTIIGPMDWNGKRAIWRGPQMSGGNLIVLDPHAYYQQSRTMTGRAALKIGTKTIKEVVDADIKAKLGPIPSGDVSGLNFAVESGVPVFVKDLTAATVYPFPAITTAIALPNAVFTSPTIGGVLRRDVLNDAKWKLALPFGFKEVLASGCVASTTGADYPVVSVRPFVLGLTTTMEPLRDYIAVQRTNPKLTDAERKQFDTAATKLESQMDAIIRMTVATTDYSYPTVQMAKDLELVRDGAKADVDVLNTDIGKGMTLLKAAQECEKKRVKGTKVFAVARVHDEAAARDDLLSPNVLNRVDVALWRLKGVKAGETWTLSGVYDTEPAMALSEMELAYLRAMGAAWAADSVMTDINIATDLGFGAGFKEELLTLSVDTLTEAKMHQSWLRPRVDRYALAHADFIGAEGYPVMGYLNQDELTRLILIYKGLGDDPTNILLSMFFANQLDLELV